MSAKPPVGRRAWGTRLMLIGLGVGLWGGFLSGTDLGAVLSGLGCCLLLPVGGILWLMGKPPVRGAQVMWAPGTVTHAGQPQHLQFQANVAAQAAGQVTMRPSQQVMQQTQVHAQPQHSSVPTRPPPTSAPGQVPLPHGVAPVQQPMWQPPQQVPVQQLPAHLQQHTQVRQMAAGQAPPPIAPVPLTATGQPFKQHTAPPASRSSIEAGIERVRVLKRQLDERRTTKLLDEARAAEAARDFSRAALTYQQAGALDDAARIRRDHLESGAPTPTASGGLPEPIEAAEDPLRARFTVGDRIAEGGMATVHLATEPATGATVVWKQAHGRHNPLAVSNQKLEDEAAILAIARHPRIPRLIADGRTTIDGAEHAVLIQEHIPGGDLKAQVEQVTKSGLALPTEKVIEYMLAICEPLEHLTNLPEPIYHRDLKPHNVIVDPQRGPIVIDFGLAKQVATAEDVSTTRAGSGTWTAPERDTGVSGPFTDVYSLGKILWYLCTGDVPPAILTGADAAQVVKAGHPQWLADVALSSAWPVHQQRLQTVGQVRVLLEHQGQWPEAGSEAAAAAGLGGPSEAAASDDLTSWG